MSTGYPNGKHPQRASATEPPEGRPALRRMHRGALAITRTVLTLGTVALALAVLHGDRGLLGPLPAAAPRPVPVAPVDSLPVPAVGLGGGQRHAPPVEVSIPVIGVRSRLARLDTKPDGTLRPPTDPGTAGWYGGGPYPGDTDSPPALIIGQVDSGQAVFARLGELRPGNSVLIRSGDGLTAAFEVYQVTRFPGPGLPTGQVYASSRRAELRLVAFRDRPGHGGVDTGSLVVYAALRTPEPPPNPPPTPDATTGDSAGDTSGDTFEVPSEDTVREAPGDVRGGQDPPRG